MDKYPDLTRKLNELENKMVIPNDVDSLGTVPKYLKRRVEEL